MRILLGVGNNEPMSAALSRKQSQAEERVSPMMRKMLEEEREKNEEANITVPPMIHAKLESIVEKVKFKEIMNKLNSGLQTGLS